MYDLTQLRQLTPQVLAKDAHLFKPRDAHRVQWGGFGGGGGGVGQNPPSGAIVQYWLDEPAKTVALEFLDSRGTLIKRYESEAPRDSARAADTTATMPATSRRGGGREPSPTTKAGMNQFAWNLRYPDAVGFQGLIMWAGSLTGPVAPP